MSESSRGRGKKIVAPRGRGRRTQAERDQLAQAERERNKERDEQYRKEQEGARLKAEREARNERNRAEARARGRGRGGFMGESTRPSEYSGPLSGGSVISSQFAVGKSFPRPWASSGGRGGGGDAWAHSAVKHGNPISSMSSARENGDGDFVFGEGSGQNTIDGGYISSDLDEDDQGKRKPIEAISLLTDDEDEGPITTRGAPIYLPRLEHRDRTAAINADNTDEAHVKPDPDGDAIMSDDQALSIKKGKQPVKDLQPIEERTWRGVWVDAEDTKIKVETDLEGPDPEVEIPDDIKEDEDAETKARIRRESENKAVLPMLNTEEERSEYARLQSAHAMLVEEFGSIEIGKEPRNYVFQFPPILPNLSKPNPITIKDDPDAPNHDPATASDTKSSNTKETAIKIEEGAPEPVLQRTVPAGAVGKLRVHKSGKTTLSWGGMSFIVSNGVAPQFLQQVVMVRVNEDEATQAGTAGRAIADKVVGDAMAFGQPRGKLIVTPDWDDLMH